MLGEVAQAKSGGRSTLTTGEVPVSRLRELDAALAASGTVGAVVETFGISLLLAAPWIVANIWVWSRVPRTDAIPPSLGERLRERLSA